MEQGSGEALDQHDQHDRGALRALRADCGSCFGLCCVALPFSASADFAVDKAAGTACGNLGDDFRCGIHTRLRTEGFNGCTVYDCFGAGQRVSQVTFGARAGVRAAPGTPGGCSTSSRWYANSTSCSGT